MPLTDTHKMIPINDDTQGSDLLPANDAAFEQLEQMGQPCSIIMQPLRCCCCSRNEREIFRHSAAPHFLLLPCIIIIINIEESAAASVMQQLCSSKEEELGQIF